MELSLDRIHDLIWQKVVPQPEPMPDIYIVDVFQDYAVISRDGKYFKLPFTIDGTDLKFGDEIEVEKEFVEVKAAKFQQGIRLTGAAGDPKSEDYGFRWDVQIVEFGPDLQGNIFWDPLALRAAKPLYEGAKVFALTEAQHQAQPHPYGKSVRDLVGWIDHVGDDEKGMQGSFSILKSAKWLRDMVVDCFDRGKPDLVGLSHDIGGKVVTKVVNGKRMRTPVEISDVTVDVVYAPAAGGKFIRMAAANSTGLTAGDEAGRKEAEMFKKLVAAIRALRPDLCANVDEATVTEDQVLEILKGAIVKEDNQIDKVALQAILDSTRIVACSIVLKDEIKESGLPELSCAKLKKQFEGKVFEVEAIRAAIKDEKEYVDKLTGSGAVTGSGQVQVTKDEFDKAKQMLEDFWDPAKKVHSFKATYIAITGDKLVSGRLENAPRLRASLVTTDWAQIFGDSVTRRMVAEYNAAGLADWRKIVNIVPVSDFRTQRRMRMGGYGNLPAVLEGAPYTALTSPGDEEATYAATKRGGTEDITLEMIKNDDVGSIRQIPVRLGRSAARTLYEFVFDFLRTNPVIYDGAVLFILAGHVNLLLVALDITHLADSRHQMMKQTELTSAKILGLVPKFLIVPVDLDKTAYDLITPPSMPSGVIIAGVDYVKTWQLELIVVPYWTDPNNWYLAASPKDCPTIEIGFLDGNEEPELFVQDLPTVGSMFNNDKLTYKIRHIYGGAVVDYRGLQGNIVP